MQFQPFQSTRSAWSATFTFIPKYAKYFISIHALRMERDGISSEILFKQTRISIHALRMERDARPMDFPETLRISIHALRMERDVFPIPERPAMMYFNPRAPHGARRLPLLLHDQHRPFQSTRSAWSATWPSSSSGIWLIHFNPRAPHGARPAGIPFRAGCFGFQSTRSAWSATYQKLGVPVYSTISIHALRMERDQAAP